jgi:hypothetical protein
MCRTSPIFPRYFSYMTHGTPPNGCERVFTNINSADAANTSAAQCYKPPSSVLRCFSTGSGCAAAPEPHATVAVNMCVAVACGCLDVACGLWLVACGLWQSTCGSGCALWPVAVWQSVWRVPVAVPVCLVRGASNRRSRCPGPVPTGTRATRGSSIDCVAVGMTVTAGSARKAVRKVSRCSVQRRDRRRMCALLLLLLLLLCSPASNHPHHQNPDCAVTAPPPR